MSDFFGLEAEVTSTHFLDNGQRSGLPPIEDGNAGDIDSGVIGRILVNQLTRAGVITDYMHTFAFCADDRSVSADKCLSLYIPYPSHSHSHSEFIANLQ